MKYIDRVKVFVDGGCRGNPGPGAAGAVVLSDDDTELDRDSQIVDGHTTNNRAEYRAVLLGLNLSAKHTRRRVTVYSDSELVVKQMNGAYRLKNDELRELFIEVKRVEQVFDEVVYTQVSRGNPYISKADRLVNEIFEGRSA